MNNRLWISPNNDLEAREIVKMLKDNSEDVLVTSQPWGASWENLEEEIKENIKESQKEQKEVYGVELQGDSNGAINIDHHIYGEDNRSNKKSSIEQVADVLGIDLTIDQQFVSANDKGFILEMEKLGKELNINDDDLKEIISNIRMRDRQMQGITLEEELQAEKITKKFEDIKEKQEYIEIELDHSKTTAITDRLYGKYENLLVLTINSETKFFGKTQVINMLNEKFPGGWSGGQLDKGNGFWGGYFNQDEIKAAVREEIEKILEEKQKENNEIKKDDNYFEI